MQPNHRKEKDKILNSKETIPPTLKAQLKLYKPNILIGPVINNMNAPTYKIAKHLAGLLNRHLTLNSHYSVKNSRNWTTYLTKLK